MIYFIHAEGTDMVKIGFTDDDVRDRLRALQTGSPHKLTLLSTRNGDRETEQRWHMLYEGSHVHGEWFKIHEAERKAIKDMPPPLEPRMPYVPLTPRAW
jgi:hypothetical protein